MNKTLISIVILGVAGSAHADPERDAQFHRQDLESLARNLPKVAPAPGRDIAPVRPPPWCASVKPAQGTPSAIGRYIESGDYLGAAELACAWPKEPAVQQAVAAIEQSWINTTGLSEPDALASLQARLQRDRFAADKQRLCDALTVSDEVGGAARAFTAAKRQLFGCAGQPMWSTHADVPSDLAAHLEIEHDELARLALVLDHGSILSGRIKDDEFLIWYVVDGLDYRELSAPSALKTVDAAPYQGNTYARVTVLESLGRARMLIGAIDAAVKVKSSDPDWKELLVTAPQRGIAEWNKQAAAYKAEVARSNEFERKLFGPSKKAMAGCYRELRPDVIKVMSTLKHDTVNDFRSSLGQPIASLLFARLAACIAVEGEPMSAAKVLALVPDLAMSRGPRTAAYNAAVQALGKIREDRINFSVDPKWFARFAIRDVGLYDTASRFLAKRDNERADHMGFVLDGETGVVETATKSGTGVRVTFPKKTWSYMDQECVPTNRIIQIRWDGTLVYEQRCRDIGMKTVSRKPPDITIPTELADGIAPGTLVEFLTTRSGVAFPTAVYSDKSKKKLVAYYGFKP